MPPPLLIDLAGVDLTRPCMSREEIYSLIPHRFEFQLLSGAFLVDGPNQTIVTYADVKADDWWVRGHVPGRPLLPGVLMLEMAAQTSALLARKIGGLDSFIGFGGVDNCKFRDAVSPPARLVLLCVGEDIRSRRVVSLNQGVIDGRLIFEARVTGLIMS